ncbi:MAG: protease Lon-related BREX system protein BrxL [Ignavibacteriaceae bacterium]|nr:protease Lon-related BREX system protein BrxL [Ignavibacteriaceae bacterium]
MLEGLDKKLYDHFPGKVVRKDLTKLLRSGINVPVFVLEYLLAQYCATDDDVTIAQGVERVKEILAQNYVRPDEAEKIKAKIKERGHFKIIDKVSVKLNENKDRYEAVLSNLGIRNVEVRSDYIKKYERLLAGGIWCIIFLEYFFDENSKISPFIITDLKPIQMPGAEVSEVIDNRPKFTESEWIDALIRSAGYEPVNLSENVKWHILARMIPFVENNFNVCELGPRGTGKSYIYDEISPNSILISGGKTTVANLFYNMVTRTIGLVGMWDIVAFDEVSGIDMKEKDGVQIMKGYMANGAFARGKEHVNANASMVFLGNIDGSIENLVKTSHLLVPFPEPMIDSAFFDRFNLYIPGWEIPKMRPEFFTSAYGFISDYLAEWFKEMRKKNFSDAVEKYFRYGKDLNQRDIIAVRRTASGLLKLIYPDGNYGKEEVRKCLEYALTGRRRIKEQLKKIGGMEFYDVHFSYIDLEVNEEFHVTVPESGAGTLIPEGELPPGTVFVVAQNPQNGFKGLVRLDQQKMNGTGKFSDTGFGSGVAVKEEIKEALNYLKANLSRVSGSARWSDFDIHTKASDLNGLGTLSNIELALFLSYVSVILGKPVIPQLAVIGSMTIGGTVIGNQDLGKTLQIAVDSGAKKVLIPAADMSLIASVPVDLVSRFSLLIFTDPIQAVFKGLGVE